MGKALGITLALLLGLAAFVFYRTGYYKEVTIAAGQQGPLYLVYRDHKGPYHKIAPVIESVEDIFAKADLPCPLAFGRYLHDPNIVEHDRLESHGGCIFMKPSEKLDQIVNDNKLKAELLEKKEYVVATFSGSPSVGPFKVYPKVKKWFAKYGYQIDGPSIEIYQTTGPDAVTTRYLFPYK